MDIKGKRIHITGSADKNTEFFLLQYAHDFITEIVKTLVLEGAIFVLNVGKDPLDSTGKLPIIFDWTVLAAIYECYEQGMINVSDSPKRLIFTGATYKTETQIPSFRQELWNKLRAANLIDIKFVKYEAGQFRREVEEEQGDLLIALSGGTGTEILVDRYMENRKPVIPLDLQIGSSCNDGSGGASRFAREALTQPNRFFTLSDSGSVGELLSGLTTLQGQKPVEEVTKAVLRLIKTLDEPSLKLPLSTSKNKINSSAIDILIITALKDELDALKKCDNQSGMSWKEYKDSSGFPYYQTSFKQNNGTELNIVAARPVDMGENYTNNLATRLISELNPRLLAMTGICAGNKKDVFLGDIIVANRVFKFDYGKFVVSYKSQNHEQIRTEEIFHDIRTYNLNRQWEFQIQDFPSDWINTIQTPRPKSYQHQESWLLHKLYDYQQQPETHPIPSEHPERKIECPDWKEIIRRLKQQELLAIDSFELTQKAIKKVKNEKLEYLEEQHYKDQLKPKVKIGVIATSSNVKEDPLLFQYLEQIQRKTLGVEMEGAAIGAVAEIHEIPMIVVKGVQDYGNHEKNDLFRHYAAETSARFLLAFFKTSSVLST